MTAITHRPLTDSADSLLRFALRADATLCAGTGLLGSLFGVGAVYFISFLLLFLP